MHVLLQPVPRLLSSLVPFPSDAHALARPRCGFLHASHAAPHPLPFLQAHLNPLLYLVFFFLDFMTFLLEKVQSFALHFSCSKISPIPQTHCSRIFHPFQHNGEIIQLGFHNSRKRMGNSIFFQFTDPSCSSFFISFFLC